jgi:uncharacterized pyridoxal phosphate-dependent enzyme
MKLHDQYGLTPVINARGTFTPLGVSRSSVGVGKAVADALGEFLVIDELHSVLSGTVAELTGAEAGTLTHCAAASITVSVAAAMAGCDPARIAALPDTRGMRDRVVLPAAHAVDYGHPLLTDIRLAGATPVLAGSAASCSIGDIEAALTDPGVACLLLVSSRLVQGEPIDLKAAVAAAHRCGVPAIIDAAAQDLRMAEVLGTGADLVLLSAQKYLAAPTAGLIVGRRLLVQACRAQERGIGRAMKATKEAICGVLAALQERRQLDLAAWSDVQQAKVAWMESRLNRLPGIQASQVPDPSGMPFARVCLAVDPVGADWNAALLARKLRAGSPSIWVMEHAVEDGRLFLELVPLHQHELQLIADRIGSLVPAPAGRAGA